VKPTLQSETDTEEKNDAFPSSTKVKKQKGKTTLKRRSNDAQREADSLAENDTPRKTSTTLKT